ncbi:glycosyltransferase [Paenibacillus sp. LHD-117]|uniref:glycosyltransferase n=1 Tax=Paenibacillus sp. LHD-117 TaxID=3071412 RepID=UPI0027E10D1F|nr:glycosyltransferase [Paenibacillus sp. LHD-117]MDQ6423631.1 glycosyltransferase [Paenibacillus sp. LHD-117]
MKDISIILEIPFNNREYSKQIYDPKWINYRMDITMKYTAQCLRKQTSSDFTALFLYKDETEPIIQEALARYEALPPHIRFVPATGARAIATEAIRDSALTYSVRLDSDNMFSKDYMERLRGRVLKPGTQAIVTKQGYIYDSVRHRLATIGYPSPSFYALVFKTEEFIAGKKYPLRTHHDAIRLRHELMPGRNFVVVVHKTNALNAFTVRRPSDLVPKDQIDGVLERFI